MIVCTFCGVRKDATFEGAYCARRAQGWHVWSEPPKSSTVLSRAGEVAERRAGEAVSKGLGFGAIMAMILSWQLNHSILWMIAHGICSWFYVIYRAWQGDY